MEDTTNSEKSKNPYSLIFRKRIIILLIVLAFVVDVLWVIDSPTHEPIDALVRATIDLVQIGLVFNIAASK